MGTDTLLFLETGPLRDHIRHRGFHKVSGTNNSWRLEGKTKKKTYDDSVKRDHLKLKDCKIGIIPKSERGAEHLVVCSKNGTVMCTMIQDQG